MSLPQRRPQEVVPFPRDYTITGTSDDRMLNLATRLSLSTLPLRRNSCDTLSDFRRGICLRKTAHLVPSHAWPLSRNGVTASSKWWRCRKFPLDTRKVRFAPRVIWWYTLSASLIVRGFWELYSLRVHFRVLYTRYLCLLLM